MDIILIDFISFHISYYYNEAWISIKTDKYLEMPEDETLVLLNIMGIHNERENNLNLIHFEFIITTNINKILIKSLRNDWLFHYNILKIIKYNFDKESCRYAENF